MLHPVREAFFWCPFGSRGAKIALFFERAIFDQFWSCTAPALRLLAVSPFFVSAIVFDVMRTGSVAIAGGNYAFPYSVFEYDDEGRPVHTAVLPQDLNKVGE